MVPDNKSHPCNFITCNACKEYSSIKAPVHILTINTSNFICNWVKNLNFQCSGMFCSNGFNIKQIWYQIFGCFACFLHHLCLVVTWPYTNPILQNNPKSITFWSAVQKLTSICGLPKQAIHHPSFHCMDMSYCWWQRHPMLGRFQFCAQLKGCSFFFPLDHLKMLPCLPFLLWLATWSVLLGHSVEEPCRPAPTLRYKVAW